MTWDNARAERRIRAHLLTVPEVKQGITLANNLSSLKAAKSAASSGKFPRGRAIRVDGVHLYGSLLDFEGLITDQQRETEASHARVLRFLDMHYRVWDSIVEENDFIRVDYHGPRVHVVITEPDGNPKGQLEAGIEMALKLGEAAKRVGEAHGFPSNVRFGLDHGACLAMSTGRAHEKDILFLGSPANHAAKLAAASQTPGIFLTPNAQRQMSVGAPGDIRNIDLLVLAARSHGRFDSVLLAADAVAKDRADVRFEFHRARPPLAELSFEDLSPSRSVRMGMASLFADIDGFTAYVDRAIQAGGKAISNAVRDIHVLREELNSVLKEDFGGKRVRFIGDCIHGVLAEGAQRDDAEASVKEAVLCASGMRSSFSLASDILGTIEALDIAIGVEYGQVPLTRLGPSGSDSVRCAAGLAVVLSEQLQQSIVGGGIVLGDAAKATADPTTRDYFEKHTTLMEFANAADYFGSAASPVVQILRHDEGARPHTSAG